MQKPYVCLIYHKCWQVIFQCLTISFFNVLATTRHHDMLRLKKIRNSGATVVRNLHNDSIYIISTLLFVITETAVSKLILRALLWR